MKLVLIGPPASGKGTLARFICEDFNLPHISTGEIFRENIKKGTELGKTVKPYLDKAELVPDEITMQVVKERISKDDCKDGYVLDGFPRNKTQAELFEPMAKMDAAIHLNVDLKEIEGRILGRKTCSVCEKIYNTRYYDSDTCECGGKLYTREDDDIETIRRRFAQYETETVPIISHYKNILKTFSGGSTPQDTYEPIKVYIKEILTLDK
ncbi:MAG: nucleoside monophosphate kinase [Clostridia bacterium]|nr:nucleoside monophosphate kinase [Clostridia bacterium]MDD4686017.1 nucleoside monophosphate kinase [Clostridia bacterium]